MEARPTARRWGSPGLCDAGNVRAQGMRPGQGAEEMQVGGVEEAHGAVGAATEDVVLAHGDAVGHGGLWAEGHAGQPGHPLPPASSRAGAGRDGRVRGGGREHREGRAGERRGPTYCEAVCVLGREESRGSTAEREREQRRAGYPGLGQGGPLRGPAGQRSPGHLLSAPPTCPAACGR